MKLTLLLILLSSISSIFSQKCSTGDCVKKDWSAFKAEDFEPDSRCEDVVADAKTIIIENPTNSETCDKHPFLERVKAFACNIADATV